MRDGREERIDAQGGEEREAGGRRWRTPVVCNPESLAA